MENCIFCKIAQRQIPTEFVHETDMFVVFKDIHPSAPLHLLIVPKEHIVDIHEASESLWNKVKDLSLELEKKLDLAGFRLALNAGDKADIKHMHVHFLSGFSKDRQI